MTFFIFIFTHTVFLAQINGQHHKMDFVCSFATTIMFFQDSIVIRIGTFCVFALLQLEHHFATQTILMVVPYLFILCTESAFWN